MSNTVASLQRPVSPPPQRKRKALAGGADERCGEEEPSLAAIEAGEARIHDHLAYFAKHLREAARALDANDPSLSIDRFVQLYQRNEHDHGKHFVIHQHNHPIAGVHYDLRLQISRTSTCSWAIPYGVPGNPNSRRQGRMAIETRVHNLWNNLIESASHATGSLLIWDTGEYEVLPRKLTAVIARTDDEDSDASKATPMNAPKDSQWENEKLAEAFRGRYIRLRLHGSRLPHNYTVTLRLPLANDTVKAQPKAPAFKRRRRGNTSRQRSPLTANSTDSGSGIDGVSPITLSPSNRKRARSHRASIDDEGAEDAALASEDENSNEAETIRINNAYTGARNTIGSIHQRHWFLSLDKVNSAFERSGGRWVRKSGAGFEPFFVQGADVERSVVTGRLSSEVMADEGVEGFQLRKMWRPVMD